MNDKPFPEHVEDSVTEHVLDQLLKLAETVKITREVTRKDADSLFFRMQKAGYIRREWKQAEEALPALMAEARKDGWTVEAIAETLDVTVSYVYRVLREHRAAQADVTAWDAFYTVERRDGDDWREEAAQSVNTEDGPDTLARRLLDRAQPDYAGAKLRIRVWKFGESEGFPLATAVTGQQ
ncbi:hypothetical protein RKD32_003982 [Streptomyces sp. SAI-195]|uniref:helix-turn-helix domain-containing protein n=1 Tax=Streptomyces sp. SAI-195 TaxID=3377734 RepID=UPI003C7CF590